MLLQIVARSNFSVTLPVRPKDDLNYTRSILVGLWRHLSYRRRCQLCALLLVMLASGASEVFSLAAVLPFLAVLSDPERLWQDPVVQQLARSAGVGDARGLLIPATILFAAGAVLAAAVRLSNLWLSSRLAAAIGSELSCEVYRRTLYQPYELHVRRNSSEVITTTTVHIAQTVLVINYTLMLATAGVVALGLLTALVLADWQVASTAIAVFGSAYGLFVISARRRLAANSAVMAQVSREQLKALQEGLGAIRDVLLDGCQDNYLKVYRKADRPLRVKEAQNAFISSFPRYALEAIGMLLISLLALLMSWQRGDSASIIPLLGTLALGSQRLLPALQQIYSGWAMISAYRSAVVDVLATLDQPMPDPVLYGKIQPLSLERTIRLSQLCFSYSKEGPQVLADLNLEIRRGERVGLIGSTGSGKSTLIDIFMGLLTPTSGMMLIDGCDLHDSSHPERLMAWRSCIAHVPQSIYLSDGTIAENIAFGVPKNHVNMARVRRAAEQAQISSFIESKSDGYAGIVGERGLRLSGGQRQRIGIARALYKQAQVLVFDEATSALDTATEQAVMKSIEYLSKDLTIIIIAHRLSTVQQCDRIIKLDLGRVVSVGPPCAVLATE